MQQFPSGARRIPVVALMCAVVFLVYGVLPSPVMAVVCQAPAQTMPAPGRTTQEPGMSAMGNQMDDSAQCQVRRSRHFGWLPAQTQTFDLRNVAIASRLCDNTPRGGVRFCHRLTLLGDRDRVTLPEIRTPLTAAALTDTLHSFMAGQGSSQLTWSTPHRLWQWLSTLILGLLVAIAAWGLWPIQWPSQRPSSLALDGKDES